MQILTLTYLSDFAYLSYNLYYVKLRIPDTLPPKHFYNNFDF